MCANVQKGGWGWGVGRQCGYGANTPLVKKIFFELDFFEIENRKRILKIEKTKKIKIWIKGFLCMFLCLLLLLSLFVGVQNIVQSFLMGL